MQNLLKELIFSGRNKIEVEYVDPTHNFSRARELQEHYKFSASQNVLILDYDGRSKFVPVLEMADFDMSPVESGDPPRLLAFKGEQALTNGMIALVSPQWLKVYFLQGHGEPGIGEMTPLSVFKDYIERQNVTVAPLSFASLDAVPADCGTLIIVAPQFDIEEREAMILEKFWKEKGRLLVLLDPKPKTPRLTSLLNNVGVIRLDNRVLRTVACHSPPEFARRDRRISSQKCHHQADGRYQHFFSGGHAISQFRCRAITGRGRSDLAADPGG